MNDATNIVIVGGLVGDEDARTTSNSCAAFSFSVFGASGSFLFRVAMVGQMRVHTPRCKPHTVATSWAGTVASSSRMRACGF